MLKRVMETLQKLIIFKKVIVVLENNQNNCCAFGVNEAHE